MDRICKNIEVKIEELVTIAIGVEMDTNTVEFRIKLIFQLHIFVPRRRLSDPFLLIAVFKSTIPSPFSECKTFLPYYLGTVLFNFTSSTISLQYRIHFQPAQIPQAAVLGEDLSSYPNEKRKSNIIFIQRRVNNRKNKQPEDSTDDKQPEAIDHIRIRKKTNIETEQEAISFVFPCFLNSKL